MMSACDIAHLCIRHFSLYIVLYLLEILRKITSCGKQECMVNMIYMTCMLHCMLYVMLFNCNFGLLVHCHIILDILSNIFNDLHVL